MTTAFPTSLDALTNPTVSDDLDTAGVFHDEQHEDANDAIEALEAKVGIDDSTDATSLDARVARDAVYPPFAPAGDDDEFDDGSFSGWTAVNSGSHNPTITEDNDRASFLLPGSDAAGETHAYMKAQTMSAGTSSIEICFDVAGRLTDTLVVGCMFANGASYGAGAQVALWLGMGATTPARMYLTGWTSYNSLPETATNADLQRAFAGSLFLRLKYSASNTFRAYISCDGISYIDFFGAVSKTLSPTHYGFFMSTYGGGEPQLVSLRYARCT